MKSLIAVLPVVAVLLLAGCSKTPQAFDDALVEVRVVGIWSHDDFKNASKLSNVYFPHTIVEDTTTGERCRVMGNAIGATGDVCRVRRRNMKSAGGQ